MYWCINHPLTFCHHSEHLLGRVLDGGVPMRLTAVHKLIHDPIDTDWIASFQAVGSNTTVLPCHVDGFAINHVFISFEIV
jgi:hypothetical protein